MVSELDRRAGAPRLQMEMAISAKGSDPSLTPSCSAAAGRPTGIHLPD